MKTYPGVVEAYTDTAVSLKDIRRAAKWMVCMAGGYYWRYGDNKAIDVAQIKEILALPEVKNIEDAYRVLVKKG